MLASLKRCLLRGWMRWVARSHTPVGDLPREIRRISLWQFGGVGDMLLTTPVILALADAYPDVQIHLWCSNPEFADFLRRFPAVTQIHRFSVYGFDARTLFRRSVRDALRAVRDDMLDARPDLVVNLHIPAMLDWWAVEWWLVRQLRVPRSIGFDPRFIRKDSVYSTSLNAIARDGVHYTRLYSRLLAEADITCGEKTVFPVEEAERVRARELLEEVGVHGGSWVCMHVGASRLKMEEKMWPLERFAELARRLLGEGYVPVLVGVAGEQEMTERICTLVPACRSLVGHTSIAEMAALISLASGHIGHDSGPFHVAVAVGTPCVAICGRPDAESEYLAYERSGVAVLMAASPERISVEEVFRRTMEVMRHG